MENEVLVKTAIYYPFSEQAIFMSKETQNSPQTRLSLLERLKDWDQQTAWRGFEADYAPLVRNVARKAGLSDAEAEEVAQETLIAVATRIGGFKHAGNLGSFRNWLYQQTRWRIADQFRRRNRNPVASGSDVDDSSDQMQTRSPGEGAADPAFEEMWNAESVEHMKQVAIARVKQRVSARQFQLFDLHVLQGLAVGEAARAAGTTMAAVYMAKSRVGGVLKREVKSLISL